MSHLEAGEPDPNPPRSTRWNQVWAWLWSRSNSQLATAGTVLVLGATAAFGGLDTVHESQVALVPGLTDAGPQKDFVLGSVHVAAEMDGVPTPQCGEELVLALATVTLTDDVADAAPLQDLMLIQPEEHITGEDPLDVTSLPGGLVDTGDSEEVRIHPTHVVRADDGTLTPTLQPGLPTALVFAWEVPEDVFETGDRVRLALWDRGYVKDSSGGVHVEGWQLSEIAGRYDVGLAPLADTMRSAPGEARGCPGGAA